MQSPSNTEYSIQTDFQALLRSWWLIVLLMLAGSAAGWGISRVTPALYEGRAEIQFSVDLTRTGTLTGENQDILVNNAGALLESPEMLQEIKNQAEILGLKISENQFSRTVFLERKAERFALRVLYPDPVQAASLANAWADLGMQALTEASSHAIQADWLARSMDSLTTCLEQTSAAPGLLEACTTTDLSELQKALKNTGAQLEQERALAKGIHPGILFSLASTADPASLPVQFDRPYLILAGAAVGLVVALWLLQLGIPARLGRYNRSV